MSQSMKGRECVTAGCMYELQKIMQSLHKPHVFSYFQIFPQLQIELHVFGMKAQQKCFYFISSFFVHLNPDNL